MGNGTAERVADRERFRVGTLGSREERRDILVGKVFQTNGEEHSDFTAARRSTSRGYAASFWNPPIFRPEPLSEIFDDSTGNDAGNPPWFAPFFEAESYLENVDELEARCLSRPVHDRGSYLCIWRLPLLAAVANPRRPCEGAPLLWCVQTPRSRACCPFLMGIEERAALLR